MPHQSATIENVSSQGTCQSTSRQTKLYPRGHGTTNKVVWSGGQVTSTLALKGALLRIVDASTLRRPLQTHFRVEPNQVQPCTRSGSKSYRRLSLTTHENT